MVLKVLGEAGWLLGPLVEALVCSILWSGVGSTYPSTPPLSPLLRPVYKNTVYLGEEALVGSETSDGATVLILVVGLQPRTRQHDVKLTS